MSFWSRIFNRATPSISWESPLNTTTTSIIAIPAVQRCIHAIASDIARCEVVLTDGGGQQLRDTTIDALLTDDTYRGYLNGRDFRRWMAAECLTTGNAFAAIEVDSRATPISLRPLATSDMAMQSNVDGSISWLYQGVEVDYTYLLHWKALPTPGNPYWGTSPLSAARPTLDALAYLEAAFNSYAKNGGMPKLSFSHPGALQPAVRDAMRTAFMAQHGTATTAGTPIFVGEGMKVDAVSQSAVADIANARAAGVRTVAGIFGVPAAYLEASDARTQPEVAQMYANALHAWSTSWCSEVTGKLCSPGQRMGIDFTPITQGDFLTAGRAYAQLMQVGALAPNDVRRRIGLPPWPGLDEPRPVISGVTPVDAQGGNQGNA